MNIEDVLLLGCVLLATSASVAIASRQTWKGWVRGLVITLIIFVMSSVDEVLCHALVPDGVRGTIFRSTYIISVSALVAYLLMMRTVPRRTRLSNYQKKEVPE